MLRSLATSITLSATLLLAGFWAFAQDATPRLPAAATGQPTVLQYGPASASPVPVPPAYIRSYFSAEQLPLRNVDEKVLHRDRELTKETSGLVEKYSQAKEAKDKADVEKELTRTVADHFGLRQEMREKELQDLEEQLKRLRTVHQQRAAEKDRIVTDRVQQLLRDASGLGWGTDNASRGEYPAYFNNQFTPTSQFNPVRR